MVIREVVFGDLLAERVRNGVYKSKEFHGSGTLVVNMKELFAHDRLRDQPELRVELSDEELAKFALEAGDLLFARRSFVLEGAGKCSLVEQPSEPMVFESSMIRARVDPDIACPEFLYYLFRSPVGRSRMASIATRTAVSGIRGSDLQRLALPMPELSTQRAVASALSALDHLIETNERRVEVLEEIARLIYREWFVHFRFPGHEEVIFVDSDLGPIPDGWTVTTLDSLVDERRQTVAASEVEGDTPHVGLEHISRRQLTLSQWSKAAEVGSRKKRFAEGDILFSKIRPYFHKVGLAPIDGICSTDALVFASDGPNRGQTVMALSSDEVIAYATHTSNGTKMPRANWNVVGQYPVVVPSASVAQAFTAKIESLTGLASTLMFSSRRLGSMRDLLLPELVMGQIDVSDLDLDAVVEEAGV